MTSRRVRISIENLAMGLKKAEGLIYLEEQTLVLELQQMDALLEVMKDEVVTYRLPLKEIDSVSFIKKWFSRYIEISAKKMKTMDGVPGSSHGMLRLSVKRDQKDVARQFVSSIQLLLSEQKLQELDQ